MSKRTVSGIALTLLLIGMLALAFNIQPVKAGGTIYIRADGSVDPDTAPISTVDNVTYTFTDNIYDEIVVERDNIVVDGAGCTLQGTGSGTGIYLSYRSNVTIKNMEIKAFYWGVYLSDSSNNTVSGNNANNNNYHGIFIYSADNNLISNNLVENNGYDGIFLNSADNNLISNNTCEYNGWHGIRSGIELHNSDNNLISNNTCSSNYDRGISLSHSNHNTISYNICENNYYHGIHLDYSSNNTISNNTCEHNGNGLNFDYSSSNTISNNTCENNAYNGIGLFDSSNYNSISRNNITANNAGGIVLDRSSNNSISRNNMANNGGGVWLFDSSNYNSISRNNMANNESGVWLDGSNYNTIFGNNITENTYNGIGLTGSSHYNSISGNNITNNGGGIWLNGSNYNTISENSITNNDWLGIWLGGSSNNSVSGNNITANNWAGIGLGDSSNNKIYHNNFIDNTNQTFVQDVYTNIWDDGYPSGGNYWSDHVCTGNPSDGSQPYIIDANNIDHYPFQDPNGWLLHRLTVTSSPVAGITFTINGDLQTTPYTEWLPEGSYTLEMPQTHNGYVWSHWLEDGDPNRTKTITLPATTWTGVFVFAVQPHGPEAEFETTPDTALTGQPIKFNASASLLGWNGTHEMPITEYRWDFGDGNKTTTYTPTVYHGFSSSGIYYVALTVYAPGASPETDTISRKVTIISVPVGGYSLPIKGYATEKPLTPYLALVAILTVAFTTIKRKTHRRTKRP